MQIKSIFLTLGIVLYSLPFSLQGMEEKKKSNLVSDPKFKKKADWMLDAVGHNDIPRVKNLIAKGYPVKFVDLVSVSPIGLAAFNGNKEMVQVLLGAYPEDQEKKVDTNCYYFRNNTHTFGFRKPGFDQPLVELPQTDFGYAPLHWACGNPALRYKESNVLEIVQLLLDHEADPSYSASDLTGALANPSIEPEKAVDLASLQGFTRVEAILRKAEKERFKQKATPEDDAKVSLATDEDLFHEARIGNSIKLKKLIVAGISLNYGNKFDWLTPLSAAANCGNYKVVKVLLKNGVDANYQYVPVIAQIGDKNFYAQVGGPTALHALCRNNNLASSVRIKIASLLLAHGARTDLIAHDPRIISRPDKQTQEYHHPADLVMNCPELRKLLGKQEQNQSECLLS
jgi:ankyrin repeat protein